MIRVSTFLALAAGVLFFAACPGPQNAASTGVEQAPAGAPPGQVDASDPIAVLTANLHRLEERLARYRAERPENPELDRAASLLDEARAGIAELRETTPEPEEMPLKLHAVNSRFYEFEQLLPPLD
ncbi:MAG TPA: hypothetical protein ENN51_05235 [candidate division WOR-3 bacterium]|uniref:Uncharacterized protein n=1 Tax=candidate division WOR-3 bacterium TaxID=2052148 RepID=A0A7V0T677_UNCW3|nr:hypothetical protein [candidate division WOR-3 bacterium]